MILKEPSHLPKGFHVQNQATTFLVRRGVSLLVEV
jgi:hypothetical protein